MELEAGRAMPIELELVELALASLAMQLAATLAIAKQLLLLQLAVDWLHYAMEQSSHLQQSLFLQ